MAKVLIIAPESDSPTAVTKLTADALERTLIAQDHNVKRIKTPFIERGVLEWWLKLHRGDKLLCYFGHGRPYQMTGYPPYMKIPGFTPLFATDKTSVFKDCVVYACACWTGSDLGLAAEDDAIAYMGFTRPIMTFFNREDHKYLNDWIQMFNIFPMLVANGTNVGQSYAAFLRKCNDYISFYDSVALDLHQPINKQLRDDGKFPNADYYLSRTISNRDAAILFGDAEYVLK